MTIVIADLYLALREAGASAETAKAAAMLTAARKRPDRIDGDLRAIRIEGNFRGRDLAVIEAELRRVKWIASGVGSGVLVLLLRGFWPA